MVGLIDFILESNKIEGIIRQPSVNEIKAYEAFLDLNYITVYSLENFVNAICKKPIRNKIGMDVRVGNYIPPKGGKQIIERLEDLLVRINGLIINSYESHVKYESLHPFMDGNGRSGRVIWAWQKKKEGGRPFLLGFLHNFYYETLSKSRI